MLIILLSNFKDPVLVMQWTRGWKEKKNAWKGLPFLSISFRYSHLKLFRGRYFCRYISCFVIRLLKMAATATAGVHMATANPCVSSSHKVIVSKTASFSTKVKKAAWSRLTSSSHLSCTQPFFQSSASTTVRSEKVVTKAMADASESKPLPGLPVDLRGCTCWFPICHAVFSYGF